MPRAGHTYPHSQSYQSFPRLHSTPTALTDKPLASPSPQLPCPWTISYKPVLNHNLMLLGGPFSWIRVLPRPGPCQTQLTVSRLTKVTWEAGILIKLYNSNRGSRGSAGYLMSLPTTSGDGVRRRRGGWKRPLSIGGSTHHPLNPPVVIKITKWVVGWNLRVIC